MLTKEFVPHQESLELKELGFDEPCLAWYAETKEIQISPESYKTFTSKPCNNSNIIKLFNVDCITAPTYSQAFRWFREKYGLYFSIQYFQYDEWCLQITTKKEDIVFNHKSIDGFKTYEEAELACLRKLIEIIKSNGKTNT